MFLWSDPCELFWSYCISQRSTTRPQESHCHPRDGVTKKQIRTRDPTRGGELSGQIHTKHGLGAVLLQEGKPVAYASKSLSPTEEDYAQIEKEMYVIVFGTERFHQCVYGRHIGISTDDKPLEAIMTKPFSAAPARLQRMMLRLQKYDLTVPHIPGKEIPVADMLSCLHLRETDNTHEAFDA